MTVLISLSQIQLVMQLLGFYIFLHKLIAPVFCLLGIWRLGRHYAVSTCVPDLWYSRYITYHQRILGCRQKNEFSFLQISSFVFWFCSVPAIEAKIFTRQTDSLHHIFDGLIPQGGHFQVPGYPIDHFFILL